MDHSSPSISTDLSWTRLAQWMLAARRELMLGAAGGAVLGAAVGAMLPTRWRSEASFMPQAKQASGALGGIAAQLGVDVPASDPTQSPHFYVELLRSPHFLRRALWRYPTKSDSVSLAGALGVEEGDSARASVEVAHELMRRMTATVAPRTGVINTSVTLRDPVLARAVLGRLLDQLDAFNIETRRSRAQAERRFTEQRVNELRDELRQAEDRLASFLERNRITQNSPELTFQRDRLARDVALRQNVYGSMVQAFETAKIEQVRDTPILTRLAAPSLPDRPVGPSPVRSASVGLLAGFLLAAFWLVLPALRGLARR
jgi:uncharacterized protein involved in exopolysaccharide biosynthesis